MITPMKKYSFLIYHNDYQDFLQKLRELGVLHVIKKQSGEIEDETFRTQYHELDQLNKAIRFLGKREVEQNGTSYAGDKAGFDILKDLHELQEEQEQLSQDISSVRKELSILSPWGNFSFESIYNLKEAGISVRFFICSPKKFDPEWKTKYNIAEINHTGGQLYFVFFQKESEDNDIDVDAEEIRLPEKSLSSLNEQLSSLEDRYQKIEKEYDNLAKYSIPLLERSKNELTGKLDLDKVVLNTEKQAEDKLLILEGWVPLPKTEPLNKFLEDSSVYYMASEPDEGDNPPIMLKNNYFTRLFEPIGRLFMLPVYRELDLTPFFAPFFMLFFGFCLGDAGYGLLFVIAASLYKLKAKKEFKPILSLVQILGVSTIVFGILSGTFFGINLIDSGYTLTNESITELKEIQLPATAIDSLETIQGEHFSSRGEFETVLKEKLGESNYKQLRAPVIKYSEGNFKAISSFRYLMLDPSNMFNFALILGALQIIFGMIVKILNITKQKGFLYALPTLGWIILIIGGGSIYLLSENQAIQQAMPFYYILIGIWAVLLLGFTNPGNIFSSIGGGLADVYFTTTGLLGDLLSYIRLFALGLSSAILGFVFNDLAVQMLGGTPVISHIGFIVLLVFGHSVNIFLASLGAFVHPMRLTFVEFYKNAGFDGGGKEYKPFTNTIK